MPSDLLLAAVPVALLAAASRQPPSVTVSEVNGLYRVAATFVTPHPSAIAHDVLTDFEAIPRFMPDVRSSRIVARTAHSVVVEQEAVARLLFFSKRIRLALDVSTEPDVIRFRDRCGESFSRYEGTWTLEQREGRTAITYHLVAQPVFHVPEFVLSRLLKRDADRMIGRLQAEMASRGAGQARQP